VADVVEPGAPENAPKGSFGAGARLDPLTKPSRTDRLLLNEPVGAEHKACCGQRNQEPGRQRPDNPRDIHLQSGESIRGAQFFRGNHLSDNRGVGRGAKREASAEENRAILAIAVTAGGSVSVSTEQNSVPSGFTLSCIVISEVRDLWLSVPRSYRTGTGF